MKRNNHSNGKVDLYQVVTHKIIELLESQKLTWDKPWVNVTQDGKRAHNIFSNRIYSGLNQILLSIRQLESGYPYSGWLTFNQIKKLGGQVLSGEKSSAIFFTQLIYYDKKGKRYEFEEVQEMSNEEQKQHELKRRMILRYYNVFNMVQTTGLDDSFYAVEEASVLSGSEKDERAERLIHDTDANITHWPSNEAFYNPVNDVICLPRRKQFKGKMAYYETALHELGHWTGHPLRLDRKLRNLFGTKEYAKEELVAELCSAFLCAELGFSKTITNNAAYIQNWIDVLNNDHKYILKAVSSAERAATYICSFQTKIKE